MFRGGLALVPLTVGLVLLSGAPAMAQGGATTSISGTVVDSGGLAVPGAAVVVANDTGASFGTITNLGGAFSVPGVGAGLYSVTVTLPGFKTVVLSAVRVLPGTPVSVRPVL